jgi:hypothetical protein
MSTLPLRWQADIERLRSLAAASGGRLGLVALPRPGFARFVIDVDMVTAGSTRYPLEASTRSRLSIDLAPRHPFEPPVTTLLTPIVHPHVFSSGVICIGTHWQPSEGLDLFVNRVVRLLAFDPSQINPGSVANAAAMAWYRDTRRRHPDRFPTDPAALAAFSATFSATFTDAPAPGPAGAAPR